MAALEDEIPFPGVGGHPPRKTKISDAETLPDGTPSP